MTMKLPLQKRFYTKFIIVYISTMTNNEELKKQFYSDLKDKIHFVLVDNKLLLIDDFNARTGSVSEKLKGGLGSHGVGKHNRN